MNSSASHIRLLIVNGVNLGRLGTREIDIYGVNTKHIYQVFAVVIYDDRRITDCYTDGEPADQWAFIQSLQTDGLPGTILLDDTGLDAGTDRILTLSTGITGMPDNRLLIVAVEN